ncbi:hypothetical protein B296_00001452 [Ensete ventricosum]|uniref:Uncharacterized protein n=1 Tax=Ensete ventricosum TaxID=4639 RepID=A0A427B4U2_ENSVE|nr:hypothetical protein B296_00001452 [Ensete ventricosum]
MFLVQPRSPQLSWAMSQSIRQNQEAPAVKEPVAAGEGHSAVKQPAEVAGKKPMDEHPAGTEERYAKHSSAEPSTNRSTAATVSRPRGHLAPRGEEVAALSCLKSSIAILPREESSITGVTIVLPCLNSSQNDHREEITQESNRPPLPARRSVRKEAVVPSTNRKHSTCASRARMQGKAVTLPWEKRLRENLALT